MKKIYFGLFLLFSLFVFVPQIVKANMPLEMEEFYDEQSKIAKEKYYKCLQKYKAQLPKNYVGPNLKAKDLDQFGFYGINEYVFGTDNEYFIDIELIYDKVEETDKGAFIKTNSAASSCSKEYIDTWKNSYYNVIDVPPGSCVKFIPGTKEVKVISPTDKEYKNLVKYAGFYTKEKVIKPETKTFFDKIKEKFKFTKKAKPEKN